MDTALCGLHRRQARTRQGSPLWRPGLRHLTRVLKQRLESALQVLLKSAASAGQVRTDIAAEELLGAIASLCMHAFTQGPKHAPRMISLLVDGLRFGASSHPKSKQAARRKT
jgi:hypothetical protein